MCEPLPGRAIRASSMMAACCDARCHARNNSNRQCRHVNGHDI